MENEKTILIPEAKPIEQEKCLDCPPDEKREATVRELDEYDEGAHH